MTFLDEYFFSPVAELLWLSVITGFCTYVSFPLFYWKKFVQGRWFIFFNAIAIGILIFLLLDIYTDVNDVLFPTLANGTVSLIADPWISSAFFSSTLIAFAAGMWTQGLEGEEAALTGDRTALAVAIGIGLQNLTEGLALGAAWAIGDTDLAGVIVFGYSVQNMTEGFPIVGAYMNRDQPSVLRMAILFFIRGIPTVFGAVIGYYAVVWSSSYQAEVVDTFINGLAIGAILYCILPILLEAFKPATTRAESEARRVLVFYGVAAGFLIGFVVGLF